MLQHSALIGAHQSPCSQFDAPKIARHHNGNFPDSTMEQGRQHGPSRRAMGFPAIGKAHMCRTSRGTGNKCPAMMGGIRVAAANTLKEIPCGRRIRRMRAAGNETTAPDDKLRTVRAAIGQKGNEITQRHSENVARAPLSGQASSPRGDKVSG